MTVRHAVQCSAVQNGSKQGVVEVDIDGEWRDTALQGTQDSM
jgi:hypothetical protein